MNTLYLFGNGFDLNIGLKTSYSDFYKNAYQPKTDDHESIKKIKETIKDDVKSWSDLELKFGDYTSQIKTPDEFDLIFDDIRLKLSAYLDSEFSSFNFSQIDKKKFLDHLIKPYEFLPNGERELFETTYNNSNNTINIITFNYTKSFEEIIDYKESKLIRETSKQLWNLGKIEHIHGLTNDRFILGVNDISQISNNSFRENEDIKYSLIKPLLNEQTQNHSEKRCEYYINNANLICLFGLSIGDTDKYWWNIIGRNLRRNENCRLLIFWKNDKEISKILIDKIAREKNKIKNLFLSKLDLTEDQKIDIKERIHIAYNVEMFKDIMLEL